MNSHQSILKSVAVNKTGPFLAFKQAYSRFLNFLLCHLGFSTKPSPLAQDIARYRELERTMLDANHNCDSVTLMVAWTELEQIKNKYGGYPPCAK